MPETIIASVLSGELQPAVVLRWLVDSPQQDAPVSALAGCSRGQFVAHFLSFLRRETDGLLQTSGCNLVSSTTVAGAGGGVAARGERGEHRRSQSEPEQEPVERRKHTGRRVKAKLFSEPLSADETRFGQSGAWPLLSSPSASAATASVNAAQSPVAFSTPRCDTPRLPRHRADKASCLGDFISLASAQKVPKKRRGKHGPSHASDSDVPISSNSTNNPTIFTNLTTSTKNSTISTYNSTISTSTPTISTTSINPTIPIISTNPTNNPTIPTKATTTRPRSKEGRRRITPTAVAMTNKSMSLTALGSLSNAPALSPQIPGQTHKSSDVLAAERASLREQSHSLREAFSSQGAALHVTKVPVESPSVEPELSAVTHRTTLDALSTIHAEMLTHGLAPSLNAEMTFLVALLLARQTQENEERYRQASETTGAEAYLHCLQSVHNAAYFAAMALWRQRRLLRTLLEPALLRRVGELRRVRNLCPPLAKSLLDAYGVTRDVATTPNTPGPASTPTQSSTSTPGVCFDAERDCADNFPSTMTFHAFKKQRDMFYEIHRWYTESPSPTRASTTGGGGLRGRVKALLALGPAPANLSRLAALFVQHLLNTTQHQQEDRLSKLARRLRRPRALAPPLFPEEELFYKDVLCSCEHAAFRAHVTDALASQLAVLDATSLPQSQRRHKHLDRPGVDSTELISVLTSRIRSTAALARLLALTLSLPYADATNASVGSVSSVVGSVSSVGVNGGGDRGGCDQRMHYQPPLDLNEVLTNACTSGRLSITIPWLARFLGILASMDPTALRLPYYARLLRRLCRLHRSASDSSGLSEANERSTPSSAERLGAFPFPASTGNLNSPGGISCGDSPRSLSLTPHSPQAPPTPSARSAPASPLHRVGGASDHSANSSEAARLLVRWSLGALFAQDGFPHQLFYDELDACTREDEDWFTCPTGVDTLQNLASLARTTCDVRALTSALTQLAPPFPTAPPRHLTPLRLSNTPAAVSATVAKDDALLQARLEQQLLRSAPASARRVLELVTERVASQAARQLASMQRQARVEARRKLMLLIGELKGEANLSTKAAQHWAQWLSAARASAETEARQALRRRSKEAMQALLPAPLAPAAFAALAARQARQRVQAWLQVAWPVPDPTTVAQEVESELRILRANNPPPLPNPTSGPIGGPTSGQIGGPTAETASPTPVLSVADHLIQLKEQICLALEGNTSVSASSLTPLVRGCAVAVAGRDGAAVKAAARQMGVELCVALAAYRPSELCEPLLSALDALWTTACPELRFNPAMDTMNATNTGTMETAETNSQNNRNTMDQDLIEDRESLLAENEVRAPTPQSDEDCVATDHVPSDHVPTALERNGPKAFSPGITPLNSTLNNLSLGTSSDNSTPNSSLTTPHINSPHKSSIHTNSPSINSVHNTSFNFSLLNSPYLNFSHPNSSITHTNLIQNSPHTKSSNSPHHNTSITSSQLNTSLINSNVNTSFNSTPKSMLHTNTALTSHQLYPNSAVNSTPNSTNTNFNLTINSTPNTTKSSTNPSINATVNSTPKSSHNFSINSTPKSTHNSPQINSTINSTVNSTLNSSHKAIDDTAFARIICARTAALLGNAGAQTRSEEGEIIGDETRGENQLRSTKSVTENERWRALGTLLARLLDEGWVTAQALADQCLLLYRQDWPPHVTAGLATMVSTVTCSRRERSSIDAPLSTLVALLADFAAQEVD